AAVLALAALAQVVELALEATAAIAIVLVLHEPLELLLALGLLRVAHRHRRARVVAERAIAAAAKLELDEILLHLDDGHRDAIARANRRAVALQVVAVLREGDRLARVALHVDAVGGAGHVD